MGFLSRTSEKGADERPKREFMPRFWDGMQATGWFPLLARNRFRVDLRYWPLATIISCLSIFHWIWGYWQYLLVGWRANHAPIKHPPLFVLGHWRSGTTLLHELIVRDEQFGYPSTFACFTPTHFLISEPFAKRFLNFLLPSRRPMDNMPTGWERPQEDEFALCNLGIPSPYLTLAFPNHPPQYQEYLTLEDVPQADVEKWKKALLTFMRQLTYRTPKRLVLKSPAHTARVKVLLEMFPDAKFVHIVRSPYKVCPSTINLWKTLSETQGLQRPNFEGLEDYVFDTFKKMYDRFEQDRQLIPPENFCEVRYEDLVKAPVEQMRRIYEELGLSGFDKAEAKIREYQDETRDYKTNRYELPHELKERITVECADFIRRYGYEPQSAPIATGQ